MCSSALPDFSLWRRRSPETTKRVQYHDSDIIALRGILKLNSNTQKRQQMHFPPTLMRLGRMNKWVISCCNE